ncbi:PIN domain nuclease, partial [Pediococcus acidilactici]|nr:PIN domain nuclease [Pediococcus acidilactici]
MKDIKKRIVQAVFALAGGALGMAYLPLIWLIFKINTIVLLNNRVTNFLIGAVIFWILSIFLTSYVLKMMKRIEKALIDTSPLYLITGSIGTVLGLVIAILISTLFYRSHVFFVN